MKERKTRIFRLTDKHLSRVAEAHAPKFPRTYTIPARFNIYDKEKGERVDIAYHQSQKSIYFQDWKTDALTVDDPRLTLEKPKFIEGQLMCLPQDYLKAEFVFNSPLCLNGPNADPMKAVYYEVRVEDDATDKLEFERKRSLANTAIFNLSHDDALYLCMINGLKHVDNDNTPLSIKVLQGYLITALEGDYHQDQEVYDDFIHFINSQEFSIQRVFAQGLQEGKLIVDRGSNSIGFVGGNSVKQFSDYDDMYAELSEWVMSDKFGKQFFESLKMKLGMKREAITRDEEYSSVIDSSGVKDASPSEKFEKAKELGLITHQRGRGFLFKGEFIQSGEGYAKSKQEIYDLITLDPEFASELEGAIAALEQGK